MWDIDFYFIKNNVTYISFILVYICKKDLKDIKQKKRKDRKQTNNL